jgi:enoyl-CoA hydratase / 3-hydroxyacyl-CoA dehydrogenase
MRKISTVGVVGAGTMGSALAQKFAQEGFKVILADREMRFVEHGLKNIESMLNEGVLRKVFKPHEVNDILGNILPTDDIADLSVCELVIEAVFEDFDTKKKLFESLGKILNKDVILATNTSSFSINELATAVAYPESFLGLHFFYHAAKNRLVEIIPDDKTSQETIEKIKMFCRQSGKDAIKCRDSYGFVVNRFFVPWLNESVWLMEENTGNTSTIDDVCVETFGIGMGPFALMNATGIPIAFHAQKTLESFGAFYQVSTKLQQQAGLKEQWNFDGEISEDGQVREKIKNRMLGVVFFVCSQLLDEKVCNAEDINRGARIGLKWRKGPVELMQQYGETQVKKLINQVILPYHAIIPLCVGVEFWKMHFVKLEVKKNIAVITIDRPEDLNALNEQVIKELDTQFSIAANNSEVDTIYLTGSGKAFVAGADIKFFVKNIKSNHIGDIENFTAFAQSVFNKIDKSEKKVIAVVNGLALGGGLELALCADLILALPKAQFAFPETGIGIYPGLGGTQRTAKKIGKPLAKYLILTGKMLSANDALEIGLADLLVSYDKLYDLFAGMVSLPLVSKKPLPGKWENLQDFFKRNSVTKVRMNEYFSETLTQSEADKIAAIIKKKAPLAIDIADKLIEEAAGCEDELKYLNKIFSTSDALLGLTSIGKVVEYEGR